MYQNSAGLILPNILILQLQALGFWPDLSKQFNSDLQKLELWPFFQLILEFWPYSPRHWNCDLILPNIAILTLFLPNIAIVPFFFFSNIGILTLFFQTLELWPFFQIIFEFWPYSSKHWNCDPHAIIILLSMHMGCHLILPNILNNAQQRSRLLSFICRLLITYD